MCYTEPKILKTDDAMSVVQQQTWTSGIVKIADIYLDSMNPARACTANAYEADE
jgi:hypothetical protein